LVENIVSAGNVENHIRIGDPFGKGVVAGDIEACRRQPGAQQQVHAHLDIVARKIGDLSVEVGCMKCGRLGIERIS